MPRDLNRDQQEREDGAWPTSQPVPQGGDRNDVEHAGQPLRPGYQTARVLGVGRDVSGPFSDPQTLGLEAPVRPIATRHLQLSVGGDHRPGPVHRTGDDLASLARWATGISMLDMVHRGGIPDTAGSTESHHRWPTGLGSNPNGCESWTRRRRRRQTPFGGEGTTVQRWVCGTFRDGRFTRRWPLRCEDLVDAHCCTRDPFACAGLSTTRSCDSVAGRWAWGDTLAQSGRRSTRQSEMQRLRGGGARCGLGEYEILARKGCGACHHDSALSASWAVIPLRTAS